MSLNSETPFVGQKAVEEMAGLTGPNVLRAVAPPQRPGPEEAVGVTVTPTVSAGEVAAPPDLTTPAESLPGSEEAEGS